MRAPPFPSGSLRCCLATAALLVAAAALAPDCKAAVCASAADDAAQLQLLQVRASAVAQPRTPNVALILLDQWRFDWDGFHEPLLQVPSLRRLAAGGVRFERAYVPAPLCAPARAALAAGTRYENMWVKGNLEDYVSSGSTPTYMQLLRGAGYKTIFAGKDHLTQKSGVGVDGSVHADELGIDLYRRSMDKYEVCSAMSEPGGWFKLSEVPTDQYGANLSASNEYEEHCRMYGPFARGEACASTQVCAGIVECGFRCDGARDPLDQRLSMDAWAERSAEDLLRQHWSSAGTAAPWFLQLGFPGPHPPFILSPSMAERASKKSYPPPVDSNFTGIPKLDKVDVASSRRAYGELIEHIDEQIGRFMDFLEAGGVLQDTVIFVTADHGEHLGDHSEFAKGSPWEPSVHVPLLAFGPGIANGRVEQHPVETLDIVGTILDLAGAGPPPAPMTARSLTPLISESRGTPPRAVITSGLQDKLVQATSPFDRNLQCDWEMALKQFNETALLKLVCCPAGCFKQGSLFQKTPGRAQVVLMEVVAEAGASGFEGDVLDIQSGRGVPEARELLASLGPRYRAACGPLLEGDVGEPSTA